MIADSAGFDWVKEYSPELTSLQGENGWAEYGVQIFAFVAPNGEFSYAWRAHGRAHDALIPLVGMLEAVKLEVAGQLFTDYDEEDAD